MTTSRRYLSMRSLAIAVSATLLAACGSAGESGAEPVDEALPSVSTTIPSTGPTTSPATTPPNDATTVPSSTTPGERPPDGGSQGTLVITPTSSSPSRPDDQPATRLSIEDALLPDDAFAAPWEFQRRQLESVGYGAGPNQTDCDEYWAYEQLLAGDGGHAMWWADGGNANHRVIRIESQAEVLSNLMALGTLADNCPVVNWNEGGSFTVELFTPDVDALVMRFDDQASGEVTWLAITTYGDLLSVLQIPLWTRADGTMLPVDLDEMARLGAEMYERLEGAGPERTPPAPTTTFPPAPTTTIGRAPTSTSVPRPTVPPDALAQLLLADGEAVTGWTLEGISSYDSGEGDDELVEVCPPAASFDAIDLALDWQAEFRTPTGDAAAQMIGEMPTVVATEVVEQFGQISDCDLDVLVPGAIASGGEISIDGADAAVTLFIESTQLDELRLELGVAAVGGFVTVFTLEADTTAEQPGADMLDFIDRGVAKIAAGSYRVTR